MNTEINSSIITLKKVDIYQAEKKVFDNINLTIKPGEFIYLVGDTGSGKSSLLKSLYADVKVSSGKIMVANIDLENIKEKNIPELRRNIGIVFQDLQLLSDRNIFKNLAFVLKATDERKRKN